jgi:hypothetical protein
MRSGRLSDRMLRRQRNFILDRNRLLVWIGKARRGILRLAGGIVRLSNRWLFGRRRFKRRLRDDLFTRNDRGL